MKIKELLTKSPIELNDEELKYIGKYFYKHPDKLKPKPKTKLYKCIYCKHLVWWEALHLQRWKCLKYDKEMSTMMVTHKRKCLDYEKDDN